MSEKAEMRCDSDYSLFVLRGNLLAQVKLPMMPMGGPNDGVAPVNCSSYFLLEFRGGILQGDEVDGVGSLLLRVCTVADPQGIDGSLVESAAGRCEGLRHERDRSGAEFDFGGPDRQLSLV